MAITDSLRLYIKSNRFEFEEGFQDKYTSKEYIYESEQDSDSYWDSFIDWLSFVIEEIFGIKSTESSREITELMVNIGSVVLVILVCYLIFRAIKNDEGQSIIGRNSQKKISHQIQGVDDLHQINFEDEISNLELDKNYREAIRYYYLWLLKLLSEKQFIEWDIEKTNSDYLLEIQDNTLKPQFAHLSYLYDYIWYGDFEIDEKGFQRAATSFQQTIKLLSK